MRVTVPASSANLGPGFDTFAAALGPSLELTVQETGAFEVVTDLPVPTTRDNILVRAFARLHPPDAHRFTVRSDIPLSGGLGSSAAAVVAGLLAADRLSGAGADILALATELEGHPDNAAASLHGGFVICAADTVARIEPPSGLEAVAVIPAEPVRTEQARVALPAAVPLPNAVFNVAHGALLTLGLQRGDLDLIAHGLRDALHQDARAPLYPRSARLLGAATDVGALGATISGAGPTVLFWCDWENTGRVVEALRARTDGWAQVRRLTFESQGAGVLD